MTGTVIPMLPSIPDLRQKVDRILRSAGAFGYAGAELR